MKKIFVKSWGCQMNFYDAERMAEIVKPLGYEAAGGVEEADLVVFNTCHIREKATEKLFSELGRLRETQKQVEQQGRSFRIAVAGCVAQAEGEEIRRRAPYVDLVFGPQSYHRLPEMLARLARGSGAVLETEFPVEPKFDFLPARQGPSPVSAFLAIQEGCDKFCTYCVVPYTRGAEYARPPEAILNEARQLVALGAREITLLGQNVNAYRSGDTGLAELFQQLSEIPEIKRLRYMTSHPRDMSDALIEAHGNLPKLMPFLHLPVQSGSDAILKAMNRQHTAADYLEIIQKIRKARPDIALSSDFIVGFPGETEKDFQATMDLVRAVNYAQSFSFKYSRRPGTPAAAMTNQVPEEAKEERLAALQKLLTEQQTFFDASLADKKVSVLFETKGKKPGQIRGRTPWLQTVHVEAAESLIGTEAEVQIQSAQQPALGVLLVSR